MLANMYGVYQIGMEAVKQVHFLLVCSANDEHRMKMFGKLKQCALVNLELTSKT
jgi:hypothetical protein